MTTQRFWVSDNGEVTCEKHGGMYLISAINAKPKAITHKTPLGAWSLYFTHLLGGETLFCESCAYSQAKAGA